MALFLNWWGTLAILVVPVTLGFAWLVYQAGPRRPLNRWLAVLIYTEGMLVVTCDDGIALFLTGSSHVYAVAQIHAILHIALPFLYLIFIGRALDTPLVRPLRHPFSVPILLTVMGALQIVRFAYPTWFVPGLAHPWFAPWGFIPGPGFVLALQFSALVSGYGLVVAIDAWRRARETTAGNRAKAYAVAFMFRDLYWIILLLIILPHTNPYESVFWGIVFTQSMPLLTIAFVGILGYGILKTQMLGIDLGVKWTLRRSTLILLLAAAFFLVKEGLEAVLPIEGVIPSIIGAAAISLLLLPAWRFAGYFTDRVMPEVRDTQDYWAGRRVEVYRQMVSDCYLDGRVGERERVLLARLQERLGITAGEANVIEQAVLRTMPRGMTRG